jgi:large subunit ribosomal protein L25
MSTQNNTSLDLNVRGRPFIGKNAAYRTRATSIPAVVYGPKVKTPFNVEVTPNEFLRIYKTAGRTGLVTLKSSEGAPKELDGQKVLIKEVQTHPFKNIATHVDFHLIDLQKKIRVTVPVSFVGKAKGLAEGGILSISSRSVTIKCLPLDIPNHIDADVSELGVGDSLHIEELAKKFETSKLEFMYESNYSLAAIVRPEEEVAAAPVAAAADATAAAGAGAAAAPGAAPAAKPAPGAAPAAAKPAAKK